MQRCWQIRPFVFGDTVPGNLELGNAFPLSAMHAVQCGRHAVSGQRTDVIDARLLQKLRYIGCRDGVAIKTLLEALQPEGRKHQQPRNEGHEQPRHKEVVNTPKVSVGSRIVTGPQYPLSAASVR